MRDEPNNLTARGACEEIREPGLPKEAHICWNMRVVDLTGIRRWFIRRVAIEAIKELKREDCHVTRD
jgi:hypothetical protein